MRRQRKCLVQRAIPNYGLPITFSNEWQMKIARDRLFARRMSARILVKQESPSLIPISTEKVPCGQDAITVAGAWWDVVTTPKIRCPKIICILQRRMERLLSAKWKSLM